MEDDVGNKDARQVRYDSDQEDRPVCRATHAVSSAASKRAQQERE